MKKILYASLLVFAFFSHPFNSSSQLQISSVASPYSIDFTGFTGAGFQPVPDTGELSSNLWSVTGMSDGTLSFDSIQNTPSTDFARGTSAGNVNTGGIYAFNTGSGNVIFGIQPIAADFTPGDMRSRIKNTSGTTFTTLFISYDIFYLNNEERANSLNFSYSSDNSNYTSIISLDFITPDTADSNAQWMKVSRSEFITGLIIANDSVYYLRWRGDDVSGSGSRDEYGIDNITIIANPAKVIGNFSTTTTCAGDSVLFTDLSASSSGNIISWNWNFGDGTGTSTQQNPAYLYAASGTYNVQLIVTTDSLESDTITKPVTIHPLPDANFVASDACTNSAAQFTDSSGITSGNITGWLWNFGDGTTDSLQNPSHIYTSAGSYKVALTVVSNQGCTDSITDSLTIHALPVIDSSAMVINNPDCGMSNGSITGLSVSGTSPFTYLWSPVMQTTISLINASGGNYVFSASDSIGCTSTANFTLVSSGAPPAPAAASPTAYCDGDPVDSLTATGTGGTINWYDDSLFTNLVGTGNSFMPPLSLGDNFFYATETTTCEGPATSVTVTINPSVMLTILVSDTAICPGDSVVIMASATGGIGSYSYVWSIGLTGPGPFIVPPVTDTTYQVLVSSGACDDTVDIQIIVYENPVAGFYYNGMGFDSSNVQFTDTSINAVSWIWDFGDGSTSIQQNPMHNYVCFFQGTVTLTVTSAFGCIDSASQSILAVCGTIEENFFSQSILAFPNPSSGKFMINMSGISNPKLSMEISNILGEIIYRVNNAKSISEIDLSAQPEGTYFVTILNGEESATKKIVLIK